MDTTEQPTPAEIIDGRTPHDWREARRLQAWKLKQKGWKQTDIAEALGVTDGAVSQWMKKARQHGPTALYSTPPPGREPRLSEDELRQLPALLRKGAEHYGFRGEIWTRARVGQVIKEHFDVSYSDQTVISGWGTCSSASTGRGRNQPNAPLSATRRPSNGGARSAGSS